MGPSSKIQENVSLRTLLFLIPLALGFGGLAFGQTGNAPADAVRFTEAFLSDPEQIALGAKVWGKRCKFCHGKTAYPGKAPRLQPANLAPEFIFDRVTNGFRGMPSFKQEFSDAERKAVVAFIKSTEFSN